MELLDWGRVLIEHAFEWGYFRLLEFPWIKRNIHVSIFTVYGKIRTIHLTGLDKSSLDRHLHQVSRMVCVLIIHPESNSKCSQKTENQKLVLKWWTLVFSDPFTIASWQCQLCKWDPVFHPSVRYMVQIWEVVPCCPAYLPTYNHLVRDKFTWAFGGYPLNMFLF